LGIVGKQAFPAQQGRNQACNHPGNVVGSLFIAWLAGSAGGVAAFWVFAGMAVASFLSLLLIRPQDIGPTRARGRSAEEPSVPLRVVLAIQ
jgi:hypothetical protein